MRIKKILSMSAAVGMILAMMAQTLPVSGLAADTATGGDVAMSIRRDAPATVPGANQYDWAGATPVGNGQMGAVIFGGVADDTILINENTLWSGDTTEGQGSGQKYTPSTTKMQLNLLRQKIQDAAGGTLSADAETALQTYFSGNMQQPGAYQELDLLHVSETPLSDIESGLKEITSNAGTAYQGGEGLDRLFDGDASTKWCYPKVPHADDPIWIEWYYGGAVTVDSYRVTTGNDMPARDPKTWTLFASTSGEEGSYVPLDVQENVMLPDGRRASVVFTIDNPAPYKYYRLELYGIKGQETMCQMSEFLPLGDFNRESDAPPPDDSYSHYSRVLDLETGVVNVTYTRGGVTYTREYFMSYPDRAFVMRISADKAGTISPYIGLESHHKNSEIKVSGGDTLTLTGETDDGLPFMQQVRVIAEGGTLTAGNITLHVEKADALTLIMTAGSTGRTGDSEAVSRTVRERLDAAAKKGYAALRQAHVQDYSALFNRVRFVLDGAVDSGRTIDELLEGYRVDNTAGEDKYLEMLSYQYGRYLLIASSREGGLPAGAGMWGVNGYTGTAYTTDALYRAVRLAETTNLGDLLTPSADFIERFVDEGRQMATYHARPDGESVRGWTTTWSDGYFPTAGVYLAQALWDQYRYQPDQTFLAAHYDAIMDAALFWVDSLWPDERDDKLVVNPSYDPVTHRTTLGAVRDQALVERMFTIALQAADALGRSNDATATEIRVALNALKQVASTPASFDNGGTQSIGLWARAGDAEQAYALLADGLEAGNPLMDSGRVPSVTAAFDVTAGMTDMLLSVSDTTDTIDLLPALPDLWKSGSITGLKAVGDMQVDLIWANGQWQTVTITAPTARTCTLHGDRLGSAQLLDAQGRVVPTKSPDADTLEFETTAGASYRLTAVDAKTGDVNMDGRVDTTDARLALQAAVEKITLNATQSRLADVDGNDKVDTTDARLILQYAVERIDRFPGEPDNPDEPDEPDEPDNPDEPDEPPAPAFDPVVQVLEAAAYTKADLSGTAAPNTLAADFTSFGGGFKAGDMLSYRDVDFGNGDKNTLLMLISAASNQSAKNIDVYIDKVAEENRIATVHPSNATDPNVFVECYTELTKRVTGVHEVILSFREDAELHIDWFVFSAYNGTETAAEKDARMKWWRDCNFGQFIHLGAYSYLGGIWDGRLNNGNSEWIMCDMGINKVVYAEGAARPFNPSEFDAKDIVKMAKSTGQEYLVFTSRHHEGFSMYDTKIREFKDYCLMTFGDYKGDDPMMALSRECKQQGIKFGVYFSFADWHDVTQEGFFGNSMPDLSKKAEYKTRMKGQLREIVELYDPDLFWFDGEFPHWWTVADGDEIYRFVRTLKPSLIIDDRVGKNDRGNGDYNIIETEIPETSLDYDWEICITPNDSWGYNSFKTYWKNPKTLVENLVEITAKNGTMLLDFGPDSLGKIPDKTREIFAEIGKWMDKNSESIRGAQGAYYANLPNYIQTTTKDGALYVHLFEFPENGKIVIPALKNRIRDMRVLDGGQTVRYTTNGDMLEISLEGIAQDPYVTVIKIVVDGTPEPVIASGTVQKGINYAREATVTTSGGNGQAAVDGDDGTSWETSGDAAWLKLDFASPVTVNSFYLRQYANRNATFYNRYTYAFRLEYWDGNAWVCAYEGHDIGIQRQVDLTASVKSDKFRLTLEGMNPVLLELGLYQLEFPVK